MYLCLVSSTTHKNHSSLWVIQIVLKINKNRGSCCTWVMCIFNQTGTTPVKMQTIKEVFKTKPGNLENDVLTLYNTLHLYKVIQVIVSTVATSNLTDKSYLVFTDLAALQQHSTTNLSSWNGHTDISLISKVFISDVVL